MHKTKGFCFYKQKLWSEPQVWVLLDVTVVKHFQPVRSFLLLLCGCALCNAIDLQHFLLCNVQRCACIISSCFLLWHLCCFYFPCRDLLCYFAALCVLFFFSALVLYYFSTSMCDLPLHLRHWHGQIERSKTDKQSRLQKAK